MLFDSSARASVSAFVILRRAVWILVLAAVLSLVQGYLLGTAGSTLEKDDFGLTVDEAKALGEAIWVDARGDDQFQAGHYPGAIHLNEDNWDNALGNLLLEWDPELPVIVYCDGKGCGASRAVARRLRSELQVDSVFWLEDGWDALELREDLQ